MKFTELSFTATGRSIAARSGERLVLLVVLVVLVLLATSGRALASSQKVFGTPQQAVDALMQAVQAQDAPALTAVLGPAREWMFTGDRVADRARARRFADAYRAKHEIVRDGDQATLLVGEDGYPFAFPLVRSGGLWRFDTEAGKETLLARRIGENELSAMQVLRAIVDAQMEYASVDRDGDGIVEYAQRFESTAGKRDGLFWRVKDGEAPSPLGPLLARAAGEGYKKDAKAKTPTPYHGYLFRMLKGSGERGTPEAADFVVRGRAIGGFAVVAYPVKYGSSGIMTFVVGHDGVIHQADLGPDTATIGAKMERVVLGPSWSKVEGGK